MTDERLEKIENVLSKRQSDIAVIMEEIHDPHNIAACLRSCDSVGVQSVYIILAPEENSKTRLGQKKMGVRASASAVKWLDIHYFDTVEECYAEVRKKYDFIYTTHLATDSVSLHELDMTKSIALVFGNESEGVSEKALALADGNFIIPQVGMIQSLNISVACAVTVYEAYRQRMEAGFYESSRMPKAEYDEIHSRWTDVKRRRKK